MTALDIDHSGGRVITGSSDYTVKIYDFNGMKSDFRGFRSFEPHEGHPVNAVSFVGCYFWGCFGLALRLYLVKCLNYTRSKAMLTIFWQYIIYICTLQLSWSPSGDAFLVVTGSAQPKLYDRDGKELGEMIRGDMYIRDMKNTKGHISGCTGGHWHPTDRYALFLMHASIVTLVSVFPTAFNF